ncbi:MAG: amino acid ABC transporter substrate-binding protein [Treponema sp.]|nr:amino acid ABC transporter substrate-binding protein [Treponema sp.]
MKSKQLVSVAVAALVAVTGLVSCSKNKSSEKTTFILGLDDSFPPLGFRDENNAIVGYDIDLAAEVAKRMNKELVCQPIDWAAKEQELNTKKIDCIWNGFTMTEERKAAMAFTRPYLDNAQVVVVRSDSGIKTLSGLEGKVIGVQAGSSAEDAINDNPSFKNSLKSVVEFKENITALNDLEIKNVDGVVMDQVVANYSIKQTGRPYIVLSEGLANEEYGIAFRKDDVELRDRVQLILEEMDKDGTVAKISNKWFGTNLSVIGR